MKPGSTSSIPTISVAETKLHGYEGDSESKTLYSKGKFGSRAVGKVAVALSRVGGSKKHSLRAEQRNAQLELSQRRTKVLHEAGNAKAAAINASDVSIEYKDGRLDVSGGEALDRRISTILDLVNDPLVGTRVDAEGDVADSADIEKHGKADSLLVVDKNKFQKQVNKDLTQFFSDTIRSTTTPHGLALLEKKISEQVDASHLSNTQAAKLNKQIDKQFEAQLKQFAGFLDGIKPEPDSPEGNYKAAWQKLETVHEMTTAIGQHNPSLLKKHGRELRELAIANFKETVSTIPGELSSDLRETRALQERVTEDRSLLEEIVKATSKKPEQRLAEVDRSVSATVSKLDAQLQEIPKLSTSLEAITTDSVKELREELSKSRAIKTKQSRLETEKKALDALGSGLLKSPARKKVQAKIEQLDREINGLKFQVAESHSRIDSLREEFSVLKEAKGALEKRYADSLDAIPPYETTPEYDFGVKLEPLRGNAGFTSFERATVEQYFTQLADPKLDLEQSVVDALVDHFVIKVTTDGVSPRDALAQVIDDSAFATAQTLKNANETLKRYEDAGVEVVDAREHPENVRITTFDQPKAKAAQKTTTTSQPSEISNTKTELETKEALRPRSATVSVPEDKHILGATQLASRFSKANGSHTDVIQFTEYLRPLAGNPDISADGLTLLVDDFVNCFEAGWAYSDLITGLDAGVESLRQGGSSEGALTAHRNALAAITEDRKTQTTTTEPAIDSSSTAESGTYDHIIGNLQQYLTARQHSELPSDAETVVADTLIDGHKHEAVDEKDLTQLANAFFRSLGPQENDHEWEFEVILAGFQAGVDDLKKGLDFQAAYDTQYRVAEERYYGRRSDGSSPEDPIEV